MKNKIGKIVLATTSDWFYAPDGRCYKAIFGTLKAIHTTEETLGFKPNLKHTNWFLEIGNMTVAGCQILYCVEAENANLESVIDFTTTGVEVQNSPRIAPEFTRPSYIYNANEVYAP